MGKLAICGDCSKAFEPDESCPFCAIKELQDELQILRNNLAAEKAENHRLREDAWQKRVQNHQLKKSADSDSAT